MSTDTAVRDRLHAAFERDLFAYLEWVTRDTAIPVPAATTVTAKAANETEVRRFAAAHQLDLVFDAGQVFADKTIGGITHRVTARADRYLPTIRAAKEARS